MIALYSVTVLVLGLILLVSAANAGWAMRLERLPCRGLYRPTLSILIPARNEAGSIRRCLDGVFAVAPPACEVIVYDDQSSDDTPAILEACRRAYPALRVLCGTGKPEGWTGKSWACQSLYNASSGEVLLFLDADVSLSGACLDRAVPFLREQNLALLSCFPRQQMGSLGEWLVVPLMNWLLLSLLPLNLVARSPRASLAAANGQFMLFRRDAYERIGTHAAVRHSVVDDLAFARLVKRAGLRMMAVLSRGEVSCRMYRGGGESFRGFMKNFFPGTGLSGPVFVVLVSVLFAVFFLPLVLVAAHPAILVPVALVVAIRLLVSVASGQTIIWNWLLHPLQMIVLLMLAAASLFVTMTGTASWKGRRL